MGHQSEVTPVSSLLDLHDRRILVTGAGGGLGSVTARRLAQAGARVAVHCRSRGASMRRAEEVVATIESDGGRAVAVASDLADDPTTCVRQAVRALGGLDAVVNNAAVDVAGEISDDWDQIRSIDLDAVIAITGEFARLAGDTTGETNGADEDSGNARSPGVPSRAIVNLASIEGHQPAPGHGLYATAKAALLMWTRSAALELGPRGIRVNSVSPGLIERDGLTEAWPEGVARWTAAAPLARLGQPTDVADAILFLLSDAARWITGIDLVVDGGMLARPTW